METFDDLETLGREEITNPLATAFKTTVLVMGIIILISAVLNIPVYLLASYGFPAQSFMDVWPFSYLGANIFSLLALVKYVSACGKPLVCTWYLM